MELKNDWLRMTFSPVSYDRQSSEFGSPWSLLETATTAADSHATLGYRRSPMIEHDPESLSDDDESRETPSLVVRARSLVAQGDFVGAYEAAHLATLEDETVFGEMSNLQLECLHHLKSHCSLLQHVNSMDPKLLARPVRALVDRAKVMLRFSTGFELIKAAIEWHQVRLENEASQYSASLRSELDLLEIVEEAIASLLHGDLAKASTILSARTCEILNPDSTCMDIFAKTLKNLLKQWGSEVNTKKNVKVKLDFSGQLALKVGEPFSLYIGWSQTRDKVWRRAAADLEFPPALVAEALVSETTNPSWSARKEELMGLLQRAIARQYAPAARASINLHFGSFDMVKSVSTLSAFRLAVALERATDAVRANMPQAEKMYRMACSSADPITHYMLAMSLFSKLDFASTLSDVEIPEESIFKTRREALRSIYAAAMGGVPMAIARLVRMYRYGDFGVDCDEELARAWLARLGTSAWVAQSVDPEIWVDTFEDGNGRRSLDMMRNWERENNISPDYRSLALRCCRFAQEAPKSVGDDLLTRFPRKCTSLLKSIKHSSDNFARDRKMEACDRPFRAGQTFAECKRLLALTGTAPLSLETARPIIDTLAIALRHCDFLCPTPPERLSRLIEAAELVYRNEPTAGKACCSLVHLLLRARRPLSVVMPILESTNQAHPNEPGGLLLRADLLVGMGRWQEALEFYERSLRATREQKHELFIRFKILWEQYKLSLMTARSTWPQVERTKTLIAGLQTYIRNAPPADQFKADVFRALAMLSISTPAAESYWKQSCLAEDEMHPVFEKLDTLEKRILGELFNPSIEKDEYWWQLQRNLIWANRYERHHLACSVQIWVAMRSSVKILDLYDLTDNMNL